MRLKRIINTLRKRYKKFNLIISDAGAGIVESPADDEWREVLNFDNIAELRAHLGIERKPKRDCTEHIIK